MSRNARQGRARRLEVGKPEGSRYKLRCASFCFFLVGSAACRGRAQPPTRTRSATRTCSDIVAKRTKNKERERESERKHPPAHIDAYRRRNVEGSTSTQGRACQDASVVLCNCHVRLQAPAHGPENNIGRYRNSLLTHGAVSAQSKHTLLSHGGVSVAFSTPTKSPFFFADSAILTSHVRARSFDPALLIQLQRVATPDLRFSHEILRAGQVCLRTAGLPLRLKLDHAANSMGIRG